MARLTQASRAVRNKFVLFTSHESMVFCSSSPDEDNDPYQYMHTMLGS